jgi:hypothetical protein
MVAQKGSSTPKDAVVWIYFAEHPIKLRQNNRTVAEQWIKLQTLLSGLRRI